MADFDPPFGEDGERRLPSSTERQLGFPCGPADRLLFTGLFNRIEAEIGEVIGYAGLTPTDDRFTQLREAIMALIAAGLVPPASAGTSVEYILMSQARARLPIFPDVDTSDGKIVVTSPSTGTVRVPGGTSFLHRGIWLTTTAQTDFATSASKTYHLRWSPGDGFELLDLADTGYNPSVLAETDTAFDSTYDDMLVARVITNSSNVATITNLSNKDRLKDRGQTAMIRHKPWVDNTLPYNISTGTLVTINWARRPQMAVTALADIDVHNTGQIQEFNIGLNVRSRYDALSFYHSNSSNAANVAAFSWEAWA